jgi:hypothetical protein
MGEARVLRQAAPVVEHLPDFRERGLLHRRAAARDGSGLRRHQDGIRTASRRRRGAPDVHARDRQIADEADDEDRQHHGDLAVPQSEAAQHRLP